jgi:hypothetical protein
VTLDGARARHELRRAYGCDCAGERFDERDRDESPRASTARAASEILRRLTGVEHHGCPWRAYYDPDAVAVLRAFAWLDRNQAREWWGDDPPAWLVEATDRFRAYLEAVGSDLLRQERIDREQARAASSPPPGWQVEGGGRG